MKRGIIIVSFAIIFLLTTTMAILTADTAVRQLSLVIAFVFSVFAVGLLLFLQDKSDLTWDETTSLVDRVFDNRPYSSPEEMHEEADYFLDSQFDDY